jgi:excisionase family DNA binding protein
VYRCMVGRRRAIREVRDKGRGQPSNSLLSTEEAAAYFGVERTTVHRWCREGRIPCLKIGKHWRVRCEEVVDFVKEAEGFKEARHSKRPTSQDPLKPKFSQFLFHDVRE